MPRVATALTLSDGTERWGLVVVHDAQGAVTRSYPITGEQLAAVKAGGVPPGVLPAVWRSGRVVVMGRPNLRGMIFANPDGTAVVNLGRRLVNNRIEQRFGNLAAAKWAVRADQVVEVDDDVIGEATVDPAFGD